MKMGKVIISKCIFFMFIFLLSSINSFAVENSLSGIDVTQLNGYKVLLKLDKKAQVNKSVDKEGNLILILNQTLPSDSLEIVYDNIDGLNNIIVQKKGTDNTLIHLQGKNIKNAQVYTKELSTGYVKALNSNNSLFNNLFFITDKKIFVYSVTGMIILFILLLAFRPKEKRYIVNNTDKIISNKRIYANTLRNKNLIQSKNIPSIGYSVNGSFKSANSYMSLPEHYTSGNNIYTNDKARKVG